MRTMTAITVSMLAAAIAYSDVAAEPAAPSAPPADAQPMTPERFAGTYRYVGGEEEIKKLDAAIEAAISKMNFIIRAIARPRIREPNLPSETLTISVGGGKITLARPGRPPVTAPADGREVEWVHPEGDRFTVSLGIEGDALVQRFRGKSNLSINRFRLRGGGRLVIDTHITDTHLPAPLVFRTTYARP